jgi:hypothetical protein
VKKIINIIAVAVVLLFAGIWFWIDWRVWHFIPLYEGDKFGLSTPVITVAGFLGSTIGTATAAILGIKILGPGAGGSNINKSISDRVNNAVSDSPILLTGVLSYFFIGFLTLIVWLANPNESPDLSNSFATGILGWAVGAFSAVFKADTSNPGDGSGGGGGGGAGGVLAVQNPPDWSPPQTAPIPEG